MTSSPRTPDFPIDPLFLERWSPRAFDGSDVPDADLFAMFEAARWAPSAFNSQPWHFLYAKRGDADWERFLSLEPMEPGLGAERLGSSSSSGSCRRPTRTAA